MFTGAWRVSARASGMHRWHWTHGRGTGTVGTGRTDVAHGLLALDVREVAKRGRSWLMIDLCWSVRTIYVLESSQAARCKRAGRYRMISEPTLAVSRARTNISAEALARARGGADATSMCTGAWRVSARASGMRRWHWTHGRGTGTVGTGRTDVAHGTVSTRRMGRGQERRSWHLGWSGTRRRRVLRGVMIVTVHGPDGPGRIPGYCSSATVAPKKYCSVGGLVRY